MTWLKSSPLVRSFLGTFLALAVAGLIWRQYQTDQLVRSVVTYLNSQIAAQRAQAPPVVK